MLVLSKSNDSLVRNHVAGFLAPPLKSAAVNVGCKFVSYTKVLLVVLHERSTFRFALGYSQKTAATKLVAALLKVSDTRSSATLC